MHRKASEARMKTARRRRRAGAAPAQAANGPPAAPAEDRRREVIARLWRVAEAQARLLEAPAGGAAIEPADLKALVDVLERLDRLEQARPAATAPAPERSLAEVRAEFARQLLAIYGPGGTHERRTTPNRGIPIESWLNPNGSDDTPSAAQRDPTT